MDDNSLRSLIEEELDLDPRINASGIGVTVENGIVTLSGHVDTYAERVAAEQCISGIRSVRGIAQEIEVRYPNHKKIADDEIAARVLKIIAWDTTIPDGAIKVRVHNGGVTLTGEVRWGFERAAAERAVEKLGGVTTITNLVIVRSETNQKNVRERIEQALLKDANLEADHIQVAVNDGEVSLTGTVRAWYDRSIAEKAAWGVPGVVKVSNQLVIG
jgi:osmotically-inducible protein OsmY